MSEGNLISAWCRKFYAFNQVGRTQWIAEQAAKIPKEARVLDVGAGSSPYRSFFAHCNFKTHDFAKLAPSQLWGR